MGLQLTEIVGLYRDMVKNEKDRCQFNFNFNNVQFDVMFFIDESPYILMFGVLRENFYFELNVSKNFEIDIYIEEYTRLCKILGLKYDPENPFRTIDFFNEFNRQIPQNINFTNDVNPHHLVAYKAKEIEEGDKRYFFGWLYHGNSGKGYSQGNIEKTKEILGTKAYERCKNKNISSRWTDDVTKMLEYHLPE